MLKVSNLSKTYEIKGRKIDAVRPFSLSASAGEVICLLGPNGAGKTTVIKMLCGLVHPTSGEISLSDKTIKERREYLNQIAVVLEGTRNIYWRLNPVENMEWVCSMRGLRRKDFKPRIKHYIEALELQQYRKTECRYLSRGNQQKVAVACALVLNARVLLLDEPTLGLDIEISHRMMKLISEEGRSDRLVVVTTHDMEFIEKTATRVIIFKEGHVKMTSTASSIIADYGNNSQRLSEAYMNLMKAI
ncbi:MAG: ABC transporter ATP-binding protein [Pseudomonadota bacterium]